MTNLRKYLVVTGMLLVAIGIAACAVLIERPASTALAASPPAANQTAPLNCGPGWAVVPSANNPASSNILNGVSIVSPIDVWAVGAYTPTAGITQTLTQHWDGSQWSIVPSPNAGTGDNQLTAVSARTANDVWAVGFYRVTPTSPYQTLTLRWNGSTWTQTPSPSPGSVENYLYGVAIVPGSNNVWAVGYYSNTANILQTLIERWNGTSWSVVSSPNPFLGVAGLRGVAVVSATDVWAVGASLSLGMTAYRTYTLHWNGSSWAAVSSLTADNCAFTAVATVAANDVWSVGACNDGVRFTTLAARWNGSSWAMVATPSPGAGDNALGGVAVVSANDIWAVGGYSTGAETLTLALHWDGTAWTQGKSANPGLSNNSLVAVSALSGSLWAVGSYAGDSAQQTLTEQYGNIPCVTATVVATSTASATAALPTSTATTATTVATATSTSIIPATSTATVTTIPPSSTSTPIATSIATNTATPTVGTTATSLLATATNTTLSASPTAPASTSTSTPTICPIAFSDVDESNPFYSFIRCLACRAIISGYSDGTFRPNADISRGQIAKMVSNSAGFAEDPLTQIYEDVPPKSPFYSWINRLSRRGHMGGYNCGIVPEEPCGLENRPYFRPSANATRGQLAKIVSNAAGLGGTPSGMFYTDVQPDNPFYVWIMRLTTLNVMSGYPCGGPNEPCDEASRPYFRPYNTVTRGQASKIVANTFFPGCQTPAKH